MIRVANIHRISLILDLLAENADHLRKVERLQRKTKRLDNRATVLASSTADAKTTHQIEEPETATYSLQVEMGLADDYKTYARVQVSFLQYLEFALINPSNCFVSSLREPFVISPVVL